MCPPAGAVLGQCGTIGELRGAIVPWPFMGGAHIGRRIEVGAL
jgi:hypothetical protein